MVGSGAVTTAQKAVTVASDLAAAATANSLLDLAPAMRVRRAPRTRDRRGYERVTLPLREGLHLSPLALEPPLLVLGLTSRTLELLELLRHLGGPLPTATVGAVSVCFVLGGVYR